VKVGVEGDRGSLRQRVGQLVRVHVIGVLVGEENRISTVEGLLELAPHAGIDDDHRSLMLDPKAGVGKLGHPHCGLLVVHS
jgi:hypothetical protein